MSDQNICSAAGIIRLTKLFSMILSFTLQEIYLLRNENSRLRGALEEFRGQTLALHKQIDTLRALLDKLENIPHFFVMFVCVKKLKRLSKVV